MEDARLIIAKSLIDQQRFLPAKELLLEVLKSNPHSTIALNNLAFIDIMDRRYGSGLDRFEDIFTIDPWNETAIYNLNALHEQLETENAKSIATARTDYDSDSFQQTLTRTHQLSNSKRTLDSLPGKEFIRSGKTLAENLKSPHLVLIQAPGWGVLTPPLATAMLAAFIRKHGYKVLPLDLNINFYLTRGEKYKNVWEIEQSLWFWTTKSKVDEFIADHEPQIQLYIDLILESGTKLVGFTIYQSSLQVSLYIAERLKSVDPGIKIVFGGPQVSRFMEGQSVVQQGCVDAVAQGEGELTLLDIVQKVSSGEDISKCPGTLVFIEDQVIDNGDRELIDDLNSLPFPDFSDYNFQSYREPSRLPIMSSRGCPNRCIFCNERPFWKRYRHVKAERIFAEITAQLKMYPFLSWIDFQDSLVNGKLSELEKLADLIIESGLKLEWSAQAVIRKGMTYEFFKKMKASGCICLAFGLETPSSSLMLKIGKGLSKGADPNQIVRDGYRAGLTCAYNFMFGLPGETDEDVFETLEFVRRNRDCRITVNPSPWFCSFGAGTLGFEDPAKYGIDFSKGRTYWEADGGKNNFLQRLKEFENFCRLVKELGIHTTYPAAELLDRSRQIGDYYFNSKQYEKAVPYYEEWLSKNPTDNDVMAKLSESRERVVSDEAKGAKRNQPRQRMEAELIGEIDRMLEVGDYDRALEAVQDSILVYPSSAKLMYRWAEVHIGKQEWDTAVMRLNNTLALDPALQDAYNDLGVLYASTGKKELGLKCFIEAVKRDENDRVAMRNLAATLISIGLLAEGIRGYFTLLNRFPDDLGTLVELGRIQSTWGNDRFAREYFEVALRLSPEFTKARELLVSLDKPGRAINTPDKALSDLLEEVRFPNRSLLRKEFDEDKIVLAALPDFLIVDPTSICNATCITCFHSFLDEKWQDLPKDAFENVKHLISTVNQMNLFGSGEAFVAKNIEYYISEVKRLKRRNMRVTISSNGKLLGKKQIDLVSDPGIILQISIDAGTRDLFNYIRRGIDFDKFMKNLRLFKEMKGDKGYPALHFSCTISKRNINEIPKIFDIAKEIGVDYVGLYNEYALDEQEKSYLLDASDAPAFNSIKAQLDSYGIKYSDHLTFLDEATHDAVFEWHGQDEKLKEQN